MPRPPALGAALAALALTAACSGSSDTTPPASAAGCPAGATVVADADALDAELREARPGDALVLAPGTYRGHFTISASGTRRAPIVLCGPRDAVLDGGSVDTGYTLHLEGAAHWELRGFSVVGGQKGVMLDDSSDNVLAGLSIRRVGDEALHLRRHSSRNLVTRVVVDGTGLRRPEFGEGIYVGTAVDNWCEVTDCGPDRSDDNRLVRNRVLATSAEAVDVKEGTTGGTLLGNRLEGPVGEGADSLVDLKGNAWQVRGNRLANGAGDGIQVHVVADGWGRENTIRDNRVLGTGAAVVLAGAAATGGNRVDCGGGGCG